MSSFRSTVENMSKLMDEMGITELDLERQLLLGLYRKHIHLSKQTGATVAMPALPTSEDAKHTSASISEATLKILSLCFCSRARVNTAIFISIYYLSNRIPFIQTKGSSLL